MRRFTLLPFVGGTSAIMVLIFLQAGQLTLTGGGSTDTLDPFVLSFFGIISGLLSERAYEKVSQIGSNIFSVEDRQQRWGIGLAEHLKAVGLDVGDLAMHLHTGVDEAESIVHGQAPASLDQQRVIGALLRRSHREIFTDIPPQEKPAAGRRPPVSRGGSNADSPPPRKVGESVASLAAAKS